jgi:DNA-binding GntR family transcriptional regulator
MTATVIVEPPAAAEAFDLQQMIKSSKPPVKRSGLTSNELYDRLREMAIHYKLRPGERINEMELSQLFSTSRTPLREALNRLVAERFLTFVPNRGFYGRAFDQQDIYNLYELRKSIETSAAMLALERATDADIAAVKAFWDDVSRKTASMPAQRLVSLDEEFHLRVVALSGNEEMVRALQAVNARIHFVRWVDLEGRKGGGYGEHRSLIKALAARDAPRCRAILDSHITRRMEEIVRVVQAGVVRIYAP